MTEKKKLPERRASSYTYSSRRPITPGTAGVPHSLPKRRVSVQEKGREQKREAPHTLQRVVTIPQSDPSSAWDAFASRQEERRRVRSRSARYNIEAVPRTLAQTGVRASSGRIKVARPPLPYGASQVPLRSGRLRIKRGFLWRLLSLFAATLLIIVIINFVFNGSTFRINRVNVTGTHNEELIRNIQRMGIQGQNIFGVNVVTLADRIKTSPQVASVSFTKQWPDQLLVTIKERVPVLYWQTEQGLYSVDQQGIIVASVNEHTDVDHSKMVIDTRASANTQVKQTFKIGTQLNTADITFAADVLDRLPKLLGTSAFKLRYTGGAISIGQKGNAGTFMVESPDGWTAYLGGADDANPLDNRLVELREILSLAQKRQLNLSVVDLRYGLRPIYTVK